MSGMKLGAVDFWTHVSFWSYLIGNFIEILLWFEPYYNQPLAYEPVGQKMEVKAPSIDMDHIEMERENELEKRITSIKKYKTSVVREDAPINKQPY